MRISSKYQITLSKEVREGSKSKPGTNFTSGGDRESDPNPPPKLERPTEAIYRSVKGKRDAVEAIREFRKSGGRAR